MPREKVYVEEIGREVDAESVFVPSASGRKQLTELLAEVAALNATAELSAPGITDLLTAYVDELEAQIGAPVSVAVRSDAQAVYGTYRSGECEATVTVSKRFAATSDRVEFESLLRQNQLEPLVQKLTEGAPDGS